MNLLEGLSNIFGGFGLNSPESKSENNKKWYDFSFLEDEEEKSAFETAKKEAESDEGMQLDDNVSSSYSSPLDTAKVKYGLNQTGYYDGDASTIPDQQMIDGVKKFQKDNNLHIDGMLKPEGETITTMNSKLKDFYTTKKYESGTEKGEKEYIRWQLKQNEKEKATALAPKPKPKPKQEDNLFSFAPLKKTEKKEDNWSFEPQKKTENRAKTENIFEPKSLIGEPKRKSLFDKSEPQRTLAEQIHEEKSREQQGQNLLERKQGDVSIKSQKLEYEKNNKSENKLLENTRKHLIEEEGIKKHGYLDTKGYITTAVGKNIDNYNDFSDISWLKDGRPATKQEKDNEYNIYQQLKQKKEFGQKYPAEYYKNKTSLRISDDAINKLLDKHLQDDLDNLRKNFPEFDEFPSELQEVLLDIKYNVGNVDKENWPNLHKGIKSKNLSFIEQHVNRKDVPERRNLWAKKKIKSIKKW